MKSEIIIVFFMYLQVARFSNVKEKIAKFNSMVKEANEISPTKSIGKLSSENSSPGTLQNVRKTRYMVLQLEKNIGKKNDDATKEMTIFLKLFKDMKKMTLSKAVTRTYTLPCSSTLDCVDPNSSSNSDTSERSFCSVSSKESPDSKVSSEIKDNLSQSLDNSIH